MTITECQELIDAYTVWLRESLHAVPVEDGCELTTPFLDRHNDHLQIYVTRHNGMYRVSDDGYVLSDLRTGGVDVSTPKRRATLEGILNGLGVKQHGTELAVEASQKNLGARVHTLVQAMLAVGDMYVLAQPRVTSYFYEDVRQFLTDHDVRFTERVKLAGRSGYDHAIDFLIPKWKDRPDRCLQTVSTPTKTTVTNVLFGLNDIREARREPIEAFAFLNDREGKLGGDLLEALEAYDVTAATWSQREQFAGALA